MSWALLRPGMEVKMVFSSMIFIWAFLPVVFILDKIAGLPGRRGSLLRKNVPQNILLLLASLFFYAWGQPGLSVAAAGLHSCKLSDRGSSGLPKGRAFSENRQAVSSDCGNCAESGNSWLLQIFQFFCEYAEPGACRQLLEMRQIALPLGVSFFTFQALTYLVDLYKEKSG